MNDAEVQQDRTRVGVSSETAKAFERGGEVRDSGLPLAQVLVDETEIVAHAGGRRLVPEPPVEDQGLLVEVARPLQLALAVGRLPEPVERGS